MFIVEVVLDLPLRASYSYLSPQSLSCGSRVIVEFRGREMAAFVNHCQTAADYSERPLNQLKPLSAISAPELAIPNTIWQLVEFAASYYHHPFGSSLFCAIPTLLRKSEMQLADLPSDVEYYHTSANVNIKPTMRHRELLIDFLQTPRSRQQIRAQLGKNPTALLTKWCQQGLISKCPPPPAAISENSLALNAEQALVVSQVKLQLGQFHVGLLYGITGSGKTEVFLHLLQEVLSHQLQALILVPEINLTPQLAQRFQERFPYAQISLLNSEVSDKQRLQAWFDAQHGRSHIILGTRLSVFTPIAQLGLIIVDEEHDESFKQNDSLRYHARDLAVWRAKQAQVPILLASATPSLETLYNYYLGKYQLYKLSQRAVTAAVLPKIDLINLQHYPVNHAGISQPALQALGECLNRGELALVFINRRGYAPVITCYDCGWVSSCRYCSSRMVYHHNKQQLKCHHCGYQIGIPPHCPSCHNQYLHTLGHGTQKLEEFLASEFPSARIKRIDRDTTNSKKAWQELYQEIAADQLDIMVGTQMLAKGHDFARLTLVIGLNLDNALFSYDFRASEDMFNILTQVSGRAGRGQISGQVLLQTNYPAHAVYQFLQQHDFNGFINHCLRERKQNQLPPFSCYCLIKLSSLHEDKLKQAMSQLYKLAKTIEHSEVMINQPVPAVMYKLHNRYRGQMLLSSSKRVCLHNYLQQLEPYLSQLSGVSLAVDVDPFEL